MNTCLCGCGRKTSVRFVKGHNFRLRKLTPRPCRVCGKVFQPRAGTTMNCSAACFAKMRGKSRRKRVQLICHRCKGAFETHSFRKNTAKYCSKACWSNRAPVMTCIQCGLTYQRRDGIKFCSYKCSGAYTSGSKHPMWRGKDAAHHARKQLGKKLAVWSAAVRKRDANTCVRCGSTEHVHAHHIKSFAHFPDVRLDPANGETLCERCHEATHKHPLRNFRLFREAKP